MHRHRKGCGAPNTDAKANKIAKLILLLCAYDSESQRFCESSQTESNLKLDTNGHKLMANLLNLCPQPDISSPTTAEIHSKLVALLAQVKSKTTDVYLGHFSKTGCDGTDTNGVCVMYAANTKTAQGKFTKIQWIKELQQAAKLQQQHEEAQSELKELEAQLETARKLAYSLLPLADAELADLSEVTRVENKATNTGKKEAQSKCNYGKKKVQRDAKPLVVIMILRTTSANLKEKQKTQQQEQQEQQ
uniref:Variant surface glycoprotein n=1 Tax=Trypanosoma brucei TaxID=5691 RepID=A0A1V0FYH6_9TRYP|nr:variant surface glycoprotein [Trypanosoma brucei]